MRRPRRAGRAAADPENNHPLLHPGEAFDGRVLVWADREMTWRRLREVLAAAEIHDYRSIDFAVVK